MLVSSLYFFGRNRIIVILFAYFLQKYQHGNQAPRCEAHIKAILLLLWSTGLRFEPAFLNVFGLHMSCHVHHSLVIPTSINVFNMIRDSKWRGLISMCLFCFWFFWYKLRTIIHESNKVQPPKGKPPPRNLHRSRNNAHPMANLPSNYHVAPSSNEPCNTPNQIKIC